MMHLMIESKIIFVEDLKVKVNYKNIKNINLKVKLNQEIELSVPTKIKEAEIERFLISKKSWIDKSLEKFSKSNPNDFYFLGKKYEIKHVNNTSREINFLKSETYFEIHSHPGIPDKTKIRKLEQYLEKILIQVTHEFFEKWEGALGVSKNSLVVKKMKGKWGYCHTRNHEICLNLDLVKKDLKFIEYVVLHELCHILVPNHGAKFKSLLNLHMPDWKKIEKEFSI